MYSHEICQKVGISKDTLRHYVNIKILNPKKDQKNGYFIYSKKDLEILLFILRAKELGFSLEEIRKIENEILKAKCPHKSILPSLQKKLMNVNQKITDLKIIEKHLNKLILEFKNKNCEKNPTDFKL